MEKVQGDRFMAWFMGLEASKYRVRCVSYGLPEDGGNDSLLQQP